MGPCLYIAINNKLGIFDLTINNLKFKWIPYKLQLLGKVDSSMGHK